MRPTTDSNWRPTDSRIDKGELEPTRRIFAQKLCRWGITAKDAARDGWTDGEETGEHRNVGEPDELECTVFHRIKGKYAKTASRRVGGERCLGRWRYGRWRESKKECSIVDGSERMIKSLAPGV
jgi:hypothetical protein